MKSYIDSISLKNNINNNGNFNLLLKLDEHVEEIKTNKGNREYAENPFNFLKLKNRLR